MNLSSLRSASVVRAQQLVGELFVYARFLRPSGNFGRGRGLGETHLDGETDLDKTPEPIYYFVYSSLQSANILQFAKAKICICEFFKRHFLKFYTVKSHGSLCTSSLYNS